MLWAAYTSGSEEIRRAESLDEIGRVVREGRHAIWIDLFKPTEEETRLFTEIFEFHHLAIEDCLKQAQHPKVDDYGDYVYLVIHGMPAAHERGQFRTEELDIFLGSKYLITYRTDSIRAVDEIKNKCLTVESTLGRGADFLLHEILDRLADSYVEMMDFLDEQVEHLEKRLLHDSGRAVFKDIFAIKKDISRLKRVINPQREVLNRFARGEFRVVGSQATLFFRDTYDHIYRVSEMAESFRDLVTSALETHLSVVSNRTNDVMKVLTVFTAILMTVSIIPALYGMNFEVLPGKNSPAGFYIVLAVLVSVAVVMYLIFKRRKWV